MRLLVAQKEHKAVKVCKSFRQRVVSMTEDEYFGLIRGQWPESEGEEASGELVQLVSQALAKYPHSPRLLVMRGDLIQLSPDSPGIHIEEALECYRKAIEIDPRYIDGWTSIGYFLDVIADDFRAAEDAFRRAIAHGGSVEAFVGLARVLAEQGRENEAIALLGSSNCPWVDDAKIEKIKLEIENDEWGPVC